MYLIEAVNHIVGSVLLITDVRDDAVNIVTAAAFTQATPVDGRTAS